MTICLGVAVSAKDYWEGHQLNNQARLGQPFNGFEEADPDRKLDKPQDSYNAQVRGQHPDKRTSDSRGMLVDLSGEGVDQFLTVSRLETGGKRFTIRLHVLFDENTAEYRPGSIELLNRLDVLLKSAAKAPIQLEFVDDAGIFPGVEELHLERTATVLSYLALADAEQSNY
jgi:hypothetical protein